MNTDHSLIAPLREKKDILFNKQANKSFVTSVGEELSHWRKHLFGGNSHYTVHSSGMKINLFDSNRVD